MKNHTFNLNEEFVCEANMAYISNNHAKFVQVLNPHGIPTTIFFFQTSAIIWCVTKIKLVING